MKKEIKRIGSDVVVVTTQNIEVQKELVNLETAKQGIIESIKSYEEQLRLIDADLELLRKHSKEG